MGSTPGWRPGNAGQRAPGGWTPGPRGATPGPGATPGLFMLMEMNRKKRM